MGSASPNPPYRTFRDPSGSVEITPEGVFRTVHPAHAPDILDFLASPLAHRLVAEDRLIPTEILRTDPDGTLHLRHPRVPFASYPPEWPPTLWLAAADLTLDLCSDLVAEGWILKDATPLNVLFQGCSPVFVDLLSIQRLDPTRPLWFAYAQFVRTFLLPLLAHTEVGWPLQVAGTRRDGFLPAEIYAALPWHRSLRMPAFTAVTLPKLLSNTSTPTPTTGDPALTRKIIHDTLASLRKDIHHAAPPTDRDSSWSTYTQTAAHYSPEDHAAKAQFITEVLDATLPAWVLDVGCNTGVYSKLAAEAGAHVIAIDVDTPAVNLLAETVRPTGEDILPLCVDLAFPTPATGWQNRETRSFLDRATGHFDTVLMLAVIHHMLLHDQIPLHQIAALAASITTRNLIIEWVPPSDPKFVELLRGRETIYTHLTESAFREAFLQYFNVARECTLSNGRIILHLTKR